MRITLHSETDSVWTESLDTVPIGTQRWAAAEERRDDFALGHGNRQRVLGACSIAAPAQEALARLGHRVQHHRLAGPVLIGARAFLHQAIPAYEHRQSCLAGGERPENGGDCL